MKRFVFSAFIALVLILIGTSLASAREFRQTTPDLARGAQLYNRWFAVLGVDAPQGNMPIWSRPAARLQASLSASWPRWELSAARFSSWL